MHYKKNFLILLALLLCNAAFAQSFGLGTNALGWGALTPNIGVDLGVAKHFTLEVDAGLNPFTLSDDRSTKFWAVQPEFKYWPVEKFRGPSIGLHGTYGMYDFGLKRYIYQGSMYGGGLSLNYAWVLGERWNLEASVGGGITRLDQTNKYERTDSYSCYGPAKIDNIGLTKAGITFTYLFGQTSEGRKALLNRRAERSAARKAEKNALGYFLLHLNEIEGPFNRIDTVYVIKEVVASQKAPEYVEVQENKSFNISFAVGSDTPLNSSMRDIATYLFDPSLVSYAVWLTSSCSPEGGEQMNKGLARRRADSVVSLLKSVGVDSSKIATMVQGADWDNFVQKLPSYPLENTAAIQQMIQNNSDKSAILYRISKDYPEDWKVINEQIFPDLRNVAVEVKALRRIEK